MTTPIYPVQPGTQTSTLYNISKNVAAAGTAEPLSASSVFAHEGNIQAHQSNGGLIYVGGPDVDSSNGFVLEAGDNFPFSALNLQNIYIDTSVNGNGVRVVYRG